jgi:hypothetical protein
MGAVAIDANGSVRPVTIVGTRIRALVGVIKPGTEGTGITAIGLTAGFGKLCGLVADSDTTPSTGDGFVACSLLGALEQAASSSTEPKLISDRARIPDSSSR